MSRIRHTGWCRYLNRHPSPPLLQHTTSQGSSRTCILKRESSNPPISGTALIISPVIKEEKYIGEVQFVIV
jgi:hypothetical protein